MAPNLLYDLKRIMKHKIKVFIAEDDVFISEQLKDILLDLEYEVTEIGFNAASAIELLKKTVPDLAILDINMHGTNDGFEIAKYINDQLNIPFIFLTSFSDKETVKEATSLAPAGYLLKPFNEQDIFTTLEIVLSNNRNTSKEIIVNLGPSKIKLKLDEILWVKSDDKYIEIQTQSKRYVQRNSISSFLEEHNLDGFERIHRSFVVNLSKINSIQRDQVIIGQQAIPISRKMLSYLKENFK